MTRDFNDADRIRKEERITLPENPGDLSTEALSQLEAAVKASLQGGYLSCPVAWKLAKEAGVPKVVIGEMTDRLGVRITNCQLGCFKVEKTPYDETQPKQSAAEVVAGVQELSDRNELTCVNVFELAHRLKVAPMSVADAVNELGLKIHNCQLGCF